MNPRLARRGPFRSTIPIERASCSPLGGKPFAPLTAAEESNKSFSHGRCQWSDLEQLSWVHSKQRKSSDATMTTLTDKSWS